MKYSKFKIDDDNNLYVISKKKNKIVVFTPTEPVNLAEFKNWYDRNYANINPMDVPNFLEFVGCKFSEYEINRDMGEFSEANPQYAGRFKGVK